MHQQLAYNKNARLDLEEGLLVVDGLLSTLHNATLDCRCRRHTKRVATVGGLQQVPEGQLVDHGERLVARDNPVNKKPLPLHMVKRELWNWSDILRSPKQTVDNTPSAHAHELQPALRGS